MKAYDAIKLASADYAKALGINADAIAGRVQTISVAISKDEAVTKKAIADFFVGVTNTIASEILPGIATLSKEITPSAVELLRQLDDQQVAEMEAAFAKDLRKHEDEYVDQPLDKQISERAQRMEKRLTPWMGKLNAAQQARVMQWSTSLGEQNRLWIDNRAHWQSLLLAAVKQRKAGDFDQKIASLLQDRQTFWTPEYRATYEHTEQAAISLIADLMAQSTADQRQKLLAKIADVRKDFTDLSCYKSMRKAS